MPGSTRWAVGRRDFDPQAFLSFAGARAIPGIEVVEGNTTRWIATVGGRAVLVTVSFTPGHRLLIDVGAVPAIPTRQLRMLVSARLGLFANLLAFRRLARADPLLGGLVARRPGLTVPQTDPFEATVRAIVGQVVSVAAARTLLGRLVVRHGRPTRWPGWFRFPEPSALARAGVPALRRVGLTTAKARALVVLSRAAPELDWARWRRDPALAQQGLEELPGIGPWTAGYVRLRGLADPDVFLTSDLGVRKAMAALGVRGPGGIEAVANCWRPWRSLAMLHLWAGAGER